MLTIRTAKPSDSAAIAHLHQSAIRELCGTHYDQSQLEAWAALPNAEYYQRVLEAQELFVAELDGRAVAVGWMDLDRGALHSLYVAPDVARTGVGTAMLQHMEAAAQMHSWPMVHLTASLNAVPFFEQMGYEQVSPFRHEVAPAVALDCVTMRKRFSKDA